MQSFQNLPRGYNIPPPPEIFPVKHSILPYPHTMKLLAAIILLASMTRALSLVAASIQVKRVPIDMIQLNDADSTDGGRFLRGYRFDDKNNRIYTHIAINEDREYQSTANVVSSKLVAKLLTTWKTMTDKDFQNLQLFLNKETTLEKLYRKGATPFKLFTGINRNGIPNEGAIRARWEKYFDFWVAKKNAALPK